MILVSGAYVAPAITMMQSAQGKDNTAVVVSTYSFYVAVGNTIAPLIFGYLADYYNAVTNPHVYGTSILAFSALGFLGSNIFYYKGANAFAEIK